MKKSFLVLGCGNMSQALCLGFYERDKNKSFQFSYYTPSGTKAQNLSTKTEGHWVQKLESLPAYDYVLIACKPQQFAGLKQSLKGQIKEGTVLVSIMAGINVQSLKELGSQKVVRVMPNTPSLIGEGSNLVYFSDAVQDNEKNLVQTFLKATYEPHIFSNESDIDSVTGVIASGPAYVFEFARLIVEYLKSECKLDEAEATSLVKELFVGSSHLMMSSSASLEDLRNQVTSKGGVTFAALESFKQNNLADIFTQAFRSAHKRTLELAGENSAYK